MDYRCKNKVSVITTCVVLCLIPAAEAAMKFVNTSELRLNQQLRHARVQLTQQTNQYYLLNAFAHRLRDDERLAEVVRQQNEDVGVWQNPLARTLLRLRDSIRNEATLVEHVLDVSLERLDSGASHQAKSNDQQTLWLTAQVDSVPAGIRWLKQLQRVTHPFPLHSRGCAFSSDVESAAVRMRCLVILQAWELPQLNLNEEHVDSRFIQPTPASSDAKSLNALNQSIASWRLLNRSANFLKGVSEQQHPPQAVKNSNERFTDNKNVLVRRAVEPRDRPPNLPLRRSVITGPAGRWVLDVE